MTISQLISELQTLQKVYGDIECKTLDTYTENEGWDLDFMDEYNNPVPHYVELEDETSNQVEKFILL